jgi:hypothetical protein
MPRAGVTEREYCWVCARVLSPRERAVELPHLGVTVHRQCLDEDAPRAEPAWGGVAATSPPPALAVTDPTIVSARAIAAVRAGREVECRRDDYRDRVRVALATFASTCLRAQEHALAACVHREIARLDMKFGVQGTAA